MTVEEATAIWDALRLPSEGYIDAHVRIEEERPITPTERLAADVLWEHFTAAVTRAFASPSTPGEPTPPETKP